jgi:aspartyl-tRNA(Asn)/glutamyl-tRNA(Gln) amidotransferase subunit C
MKIDVTHVAKLANLSLSPEEEKKFETQLSEVLDMVGKLNEVDTTGIEETSQVTGLENVTREDVPAESLKQEEALSNASPARNASQRDAGGAQHNGLFMVEGIFDSE